MTTLINQPYQFKSIVKIETMYGRRNNATSYVTLFFNNALQREFGLTFLRAYITRVEITMNPNNTNIISLDSEKFNCIFSIKVTSSSLVLNRTFIIKIGYNTIYEAVYIIHLEKLVSIIFHPLFLQHLFSALIKI